LQKEGSIEDFLSLGSYKLTKVHFEILPYIPHLM